MYFLNTIQAGSIHSVAEALLLLLESTAEPIIPYNLHSICLSAASNYLQCKQVCQPRMCYLLNSHTWLVWYIILDTSL